jgi:hypothetical protein
VLLEHNDFKDLKVVSQKADTLWQLCPRGDPLAAVTEIAEDAGVAGLIAGIGQRSAKDRSATQAAKNKGGSKKNIIYCWRHHQFGAKAYSCADPSVCMWAGN